MILCECMEINTKIEIKTYDETFVFLAEEIGVLQIIKLFGPGLTVPQGHIQAKEVIFEEGSTIECGLANQTYSYNKDTFAENVIHNFKELLGVDMSLVGVVDNQ